MSTQELTPRLSRYRSVRQAHNAPQATTNAFATPPPSLPNMNMRSRPDPNILPLQSTSPASVQLSAGAFARPSSGPLAQRSQHSIQDHAGASADTIPTPMLKPTVTEQEQLNEATVQRSMSRYHKKPKPGMPSAQPALNTSTPPVPSMPQQQAIYTGAVQPKQICQKSGSEARNQQQVNLVVHERTVRDHKRVSERQRNSQIAQDGNVFAGGQRTRLAQTRPERVEQAVFVSPQTTPGMVPVTLTPSKSRYRRQPGQSPAQTLEQTRLMHDLPQPPMMPAKLQHDHREAMRKFQKQASFPSQTQQLSSLLTKASLERLPDDTEPESAVIKRRVSQIKAQGLQRRKTEQDEAERAQREVQRLLDSEAERQRKMQTKLRTEKEELDRTKAMEAVAMKQRQAEEAQREKERQLEERERRLEEKERQHQMKERGEIHSPAEPFPKHETQVQPQTRPQTEPTPPPDPPRGRRESNEQRVDRHRKRSLSALEGKPIMKKSSRDEVPPIPPTPTDSFESKVPFVGFLKKRRHTDATKSQIPDRSKSQKKPSGKDIKQGGGGVVPGIDAPISAVNAGERRILVECNKSSMFMPVTPTTTPIDLIRSAATVMSEPIDPKASVLIESFGKVGVQRPLRRYEHIRDIMNSWDDDQQNSLILMPSATGGQDTDLDSSSVKPAQPEGFGCYMHYSQKPGKWDKKWIALRSDGQILFAKNEGHKDTTNICHMTDFDIYTPEHRSLSKKVKPPKKICFAIKSQQKSSMFMSLEDFVHFFSTSDKQIAADWYKAVQGWRSWYLVNVLGEGKKPGNSKTEAAAPLLSDLGNGNTQHLKSGSVDSHYQLGSFKPLLDLGDFGASEKPDGNDGSHARSHFSRADGPPSAFPKWLIDSIDPGTPANHNRTGTSGSGNFGGTNRGASIKHNTSVKHDPSLRHRELSDPTTTDPKLNANLKPEDSTFAASGLLGCSYSTRQKQHSEREATNKASGPFVQGGLLDTMGQISNTMTSPAPPTATLPSHKSVEPRPQTSDLNRTASRRTLGAHKPLADSATLPEGSHAIPVPASTDWRARPTTRGTDTAHPQSHTRSRSKSLHRPAEDERRDSPFTADGLLAGSKHGWSTQMKGRSVMDGRNVGAEGPLLDVKETSLYAEGSLLYRRELEHPSEPIIDRSKGVEVLVGTGEGIR